jgi:hypothetical protein
LVTGAGVAVEAARLAASAVDGRSVSSTSEEPKSRRSLVGMPSARQGPSGQITPGTGGRLAPGASGNASSGGPGVVSGLAVYQ